MIKHQLEEDSFSCKVILVKENDSWDDIKSKISFREPNSSRVFIILKNFHLISPESLQIFQEFCGQMSLKEKMCIIIIHQRLLEFDFQGMVSEKLHVPPLNDADAKMLFCKRAFNCDPQFQVLQGDEEHINYLVDQCSGLPGLIINLADKWKGWSSLTSLAEFCEFFRKQSNVFSYMKDVICPHKDISKSFDYLLEHLPENLKIHLAKLSIFRGSVSIRDMKFMIDGSSELTTKYEVALPLVFHGFLKENKKKFKMQPLIRDVASQQLYHMYNEDINRLKYVHLIGNVLLKAEEIYQKNMPVQTLGIMKDNWDNIEFLLRQGIHLKTDGKSVSVLFQVSFLFQLWNLQDNWILPEI